MRPMDGEDEEIVASFGNEGTTIRVPRLFSRLVGTASNLHLKSGTFSTMMAQLARHFVCLALKRKCAMALVVRRLWMVVARTIG